MREDGRENEKMPSEEDIFSFIALGYQSNGFRFKPLYCSIAPVDLELREPPDLTVFLAFGLYLTSNL